VRLVEESLRHRGTDPRCDTPFVPLVSGSSLQHPAAHEPVRTTPRATRSFRLVPASGRCVRLQLHPKLAKHFRVGTAYADAGGRGLELDGPVDLINGHNRR
jgi:hypothetical protein